MVAPPAPSPLPDATPARVSVIVPGFGVAAFLGEALTSLQRQTLTAWEAVVVDDGDRAVAKAVAPFLADPRIRLLETDSHGVSAARNAAIAASHAPLIALLDGDDLFRPDYLARTVALLEQHAEVRLATCNARMFGAVAGERHCVENPQAPRGIWIDVLDRTFNVYIGSTFRRADCLAVGGFDETMTHAEDLDLWVRLMALGGQAHYVDEVLCEYRVRAGSASAQAMRLLRGSLKVQAKARATLRPGAPEIPRIEQLMNETRDALAFEEAIDRIVAGQARSGLADLRRIGSQMDGPMWQIAMALWHWLPGLAAPMLRWRRRAHRRGGASGTPAPSFLEAEQ